MRILLACDQKWRDLPSLVVIKYHLERLGHRVFIFSIKEFESILPLCQPDAVVLNNFWDRRYHRLAKRLRLAGIAVIVLPTEGATPTHLWGPMVFGEFSDYSLVDFQLCWNSETAEGIANYGTMPRERLTVVGCPRFDFAVSPLVETCNTREQFCRQFDLDPGRPIIAWASRFALAKLAYAPSEQRERINAVLDEIGYRQSVEKLGYEMDELIDIYKVSLDKFIDAFGAAAYVRRELQFVFKPHPNDDIDYVEKRIAAVAPPSIKLAVGVYIGDVLRGCDVLVNADCNTSIEAWIHDVPVVDAQLHVDYVAGRPDISAGNWVAHDHESIVTLIDRGVVDRTVSKELLAVREAFIAKWFDRVDGHRCGAAAAAIDGFVCMHGRRKKFYPISHGGGIRHVVKRAIAWRVNLPGDVGWRDLLRRRARAKVKGGVFDKTISRDDVRVMERRLKPILATPT